MMFKKNLHFLFPFLLLVGCVDIEECDSVSNIEVAKVYFEAEMSQKWDITYGLRVDDFKSIVPFKVYKKQMTKDAAGWKMLNFKLGDVQSGGNESTLQVEITEELPLQLIKDNISTISFKGVVKLKCIDNQWRIVEAPSRSHYSMNSKLSM